MMNFVLYFEGFWSFGYKTQIVKYQTSINITKIEKILPVPIINRF